MLFALVRGVFSTPYFQPGHPKVKNFNDRFNTADTYYAAASELLEQAAEDKVSEKELSAVRKQALAYLDISLRHRARDAYTWQLKAQQEMALNDPEAALLSWQTSNRLAPNNTALTGPRLRVAARLWRQLPPADQQEMYRQIRAGWEVQYGIHGVVQVSLKSPKRQRIVKTAIKDLPGALDTFRHRLKLLRPRK